MKRTLLLFLFASITFSALYAQDVDYVISDPKKERKELEMALQDATERYLKFRHQFASLEQLIPQYHIASYLGISATQLSRLRNKLSKKS